MLLTEEEKKDSINFKQPDIRSQKNVIKEQKNNNILRILLIIIGITLLILLMSFIIFSIYVSKNTSIANGISIKNIDISGLTYEEAKSKVESSLKNSMDENITIEKEGKDLRIAFDPKFLIDVLRVIDEEEVNLYLFNAKAPCFIRDDNSYIYLILPVNLIE